MNNANFQRGQLLYQQSRYQEAAAEFRQGLMQEEDFLTHGYLALSLSELEQFPEATEHAHQASEPGSASQVLAYIAPFRDRRAS